MERVSELCFMQSQKRHAHDLPGAAPSVHGEGVRKRGRTDANQARIVEALRRIGASVSVTSGVGNGFPDLLVGYRGQTTLLEVKDGEKPPSKRALTEAEAYFLDSWRGGPAVVVESEHEAIAAVLKLRGSR